MLLNQIDYQVMHQKSSRQSGFTLMELMVTIAIAAILMGIAIPSFIATIKSNRLTTQVNALVSSLNFARSEAIKRGLRVTLCKSGDGATCVANATSDWSQGWIIFTDQDDDATYDSDTETLLKVEGSAGNQITMIGTSNNVRDYLSYVANGLNRKINGTVQNGTISVCDDRTGNIGKDIVINAVGRPRIDDDQACP
jgi:type IV fimbrial biogenesis protein FimT